MILPVAYLDGYWCVLNSQWKFWFLSVVFIIVLLPMIFMTLPHFTSRASGAEDEESNSCTSCLFYPVDKKMPAIRISTSRRRELVGKVRSAVMKSFLFTFIIWCNCIVLHCDYIVYFELYYIVSYYIVMYCIALYCIVLYCIVMYCIVL